MERRIGSPYPPRLEQIVDALPGQIAYWDRNLICRYANRAYLDYFSQSRERLIGISMQDLLGEAMFRQNQDIIDGILRGEAQSFVRPMHKLNGSAAMVQVTYVADRDPDGTVAGFCVSVNDVTEFKRIEQQLRENEAELTTLVRRRDEVISWLEMAEGIAHVGHWRMNLSDAGLTWSDEMYRIHGVTRDEYVPESNTALAFYSPEDRPRIQALMRRTLTEGLPYEDVGCVLRRDGEARYVKTQTMAAMDADGVPKMMFGVVMDITDQQRTEQALRVAYERLEAVVHVDGLTGIGNRRRFDESLGLEWQAALRTGQPLSIVLIDVDRFKSFNDTYGHQLGDKCLQAVAQAIRSVAYHDRHLVARYGGEEFVMLLPAIDRTRAVRIAERARHAVAELGLAHAGSASGVVTISAGIGIAETAQPGCDAQRQLIAEADAMLYRAKAGGRNRVVSYPDGIKAYAGDHGVGCRLDLP